MKQMSIWQNRLKVLNWNNLLTIMSKSKVILKFPKLVSHQIDNTN